MAAQQSISVTSSSLTPESLKSAEFMPSGHFRTTEEQFPDMEAAFSSAPSKKSKTQQNK